MISSCLSAMSCCRACVSVCMCGVCACAHVCVCGVCGVPCVVCWYVKVKQWSYLYNSCRSVTGARGTPCSLVSVSLPINTVLLFSPPPLPHLISAAFLTQTVNLDDTTVKFEIWDTAGQERYHSLAPMYYRGAQAAIVVYDITNQVREGWGRRERWGGGRE